MAQLFKKVLSPRSQQQLRRERQGCSFFSLMVSELIDISITRLLGVSVKFLSPRQMDIVLTFLRAVQISGAISLTDGTRESQGNLNSLQAVHRQSHTNLVHAWCIIRRIWLLEMQQNIHMYLPYAAVFFRKANTQKLWARLEQNHCRRMRTTQ